MARRYPERGLTSLNRYLTQHWLKAAFGKVRKDAAAGVDGVMAREYEGQTASHLPELLNLAHSGRYFAPPVRRTYIEKPGKSEKRPLGIPTVEDKVLQGAVVMRVEPIYEAEFYDFSYGFRPGGSAHDAIPALHHAVNGTTAPERLEPNLTVPDAAARVYADPQRRSSRRENANILQGIPSDQEEDSCATHQPSARARRSGWSAENLRARCRVSLEQEFGAAKRESKRGGGRANATLDAWEAGGG
jgi:hypothetical protein